MNSLSLPLTEHRHSPLNQAPQFICGVAGQTRNLLPAPRDLSFANAFQAVEVARIKMSSAIQCTVIGVLHHPDLSTALGRIELSYRAERCPGRHSERRPPLHRCRVRFEVRSRIPDGDNGQTTLPGHRCSPDSSVPLIDRHSASPSPGRCFPPVNAGCPPTLLQPLAVFRQTLGRTTVCAQTRS